MSEDETTHNDECCPECWRFMRERDKYKAEAHVLNFERDNAVAVVDRIRRASGKSIGTLIRELEADEHYSDCGGDVCGVGMGGYCDACMEADDE